MAGPLSPAELLNELVRSVDVSGWQSLVLSNRKPFQIRAFRGDEKGFTLRVYIWNCTHGGGQARAADEYRVQLTGVVPGTAAGELTLLLGWHSKYEVFVAFDIRKHEGQASQSPSIQVKEETLRNAQIHAFAIHHRQNGEIAVAFRPEFLIEYALNASSLHSTGKAAADIALLNQLDTLTDKQISEIKNHERRTVVAQIARKYRAADFRRRVLGAYSHRCAACGVQLELIDAAHIIPVAAPTSTDETKNGVALCKLHHAAYDKNLISFDERYKIEVSDSEIARLTASRLAGGLKAFKMQLRPMIVLPNDVRDNPPPKYIAEARRVRNWR